MKFISPLFYLHNFQNFQTNGRDIYSPFSYLIFKTIKQGKRVIIPLQSHLLPSPSSPNPLLLSSSKLPNIVVIVKSQ